MRPERGARRLALAAGLAIALGMPGLAGAHPLGNFSINHYTALRTERDAVVVRYVVDLAEIPTFQEIQETGLVPEAGHPSLGPYLSRRAENLKQGLRVEADGRRLDLQVDSTAIAFAPGAGTLPTMRVDLVYRGRLGAAGEPVQLTYQDGNDVGRAGWREIVAAAGPGTALAESTAPAVDVSRGLLDYPAELLQRPPQEVSARIVFSREVGVAAQRPAAAPPYSREGAAAPAVPRSASPPSRTVDDLASERDPAARRRETAAPQPVESQSAEPRSLEPRSVEPRHPGGASMAASAPPAAAVIATSAPPAQRRIAGPPSALASLITPGGLGVGIASSALLVAAALGALHALEPGHGKTVVAAYLVGARGTAWHAAMLGLIVTASHTAGVFLLGAATVYASRYVVPDRLYPCLAAGSGLAIAVLGIVLFLRRLAGHEIGHHRGPGHGHDHPHGHLHGHAHGHGHEHARGHEHEQGHDHEQEHGQDHEQEHGHDQAHGDDHDHGHAHGHAHDHPALAGRPHDVRAAHHPGHPRHHHHHELPPNVSLGQLLTLGVSGGIVPCPAALVVLLSAISLRRVGFGLLLVAAFSAGLAAVLVVIGILMVHARRLMARFTGDGPLIRRWLPLASSAAVACFGLGITVQALTG